MKRFFCFYVCWGQCCGLGGSALLPLVHLSCALAGLVLVPQIRFLFIYLFIFFFGGGGAAFPSASWPLSFLSLFFLFLRPCLIHARMPEIGRAFVHGHTFLHSWSGPMTLVVSLLHGATPQWGLVSAETHSPV